MKKLAGVGSGALGAAPSIAQLARSFGDHAASLLAPLLRLKNGFYAFESALHVFPDVTAGGERGLLEWNATELWRGEYAGMADGAVYFAEDVFGAQFCVREHAVCTFDPETGEFETIARDLDEWATAVLDEYSLLTGFPLAHEWQTQHGMLPAGSRLVPKQPFVLGGEFALENLHALDAVKGMKFRADIAVQVRDLPDGASVELKVID